MREKKLELTDIKGYFQGKKYVVDTVIWLCHVYQFIYIELENLNTKEMQFTVPGVVHVYP